MEKVNVIMNIHGKRGVSPIVATVLLMMIVIILAVIILLWMRGFSQESLTKEISGNEKSVDQLCSEIRIDPIVEDDGSFGFVNVGNIPLYSVNIRVSNEGRSNVIELGEEGAVGPGFNLIVDNSEIDLYEDYEEVKIIPILAGKSGSGGVKEYVCPERNWITL